jgi:hypothetical protein
MKWCRSANLLKNQQNVTEITDVNLVESIPLLKTAFH